jgi:hypothetical protein
VSHASPRVEVSFLCVAGKYAGDLAAVHAAFAPVAASLQVPVEFLYVLDGSNAGQADAVTAAAAASGFPTRVFRTARGFGRALALHFGFARAQGRLVVSIPDRFQVEPAAAQDVLRALERGADVVVTRREPRGDALLNRIQSRVFHGLVRRISGQSFRDLTCEMRGFRTEVARRLELYGDLHRFIPVLAVRQGFSVVEIPVPQREEDRTLRVFVPGVYARRLLDVLHVLFLTRFTSKPLRFFGLLGLLLAGAGGIITGVLGVQRILGWTSLADRPLLLLGVLLIVLGVQVVSIGLIGEIVLFLSPRRDLPEVTELGRDAE